MLKMKIDDPLDAVAGENLELNFIVLVTLLSWANSSIDSW